MKNLYSSFHDSFHCSDGFLSEFSSYLATIPFAEQFLVPLTCCVFLVTDSMGGIRLKRSLTDLLQYCLLTGWEWWDVLMAAHLGTPAG